MESKRFKKTMSIALAVGVIAPALITSNTVSASNQLFPDTEGHWAKSDIHSLYNSNLINGYPDGDFKPNNFISREEVSTMLSRLLGETSLNEENYNLVDIEERWSTGYIKHLLQEDILRGYDDNTFKPTNNVTRAELATMVSRILSRNGIESGGTFEQQQFADIMDAVWAIDDIAEIAEFDIVKGRDERNFAPNDNATRAEVATMISRMIKVINENNDNNSIPENVEILSATQIATNLVNRNQPHVSRRYIKETMIRDNDFSSAEVNYAMSQIEDKYNWADFAYGTAQLMIDNYDSFSEQRIIEILAQDEFKRSEVDYAMSNLRANWNEQALLYAKHLMRSGHPYTQDELRLDLIQQGKFTSTQADYALDKIVVKDSHEIVNIH